MYHLKNQAFTLVELIVVITILAILGTIAFISLQGYSKNARESTRISDLGTIAKALELYRTTESTYPQPTDIFNVTYTGALAWEQGVFGEATRSKVGRISQVPLDPLMGNPYTYSLTNTKQEYELGAISESLLSDNVPFLISPTYAANSFFSIIKGNYNKKIISVQTPGQIYILGIPTIITSASSDSTVEDIFGNQKFSVQNSQVLPGSYMNSLPDGEILSQGDSFIPGMIAGITAPIIYSGSIMLLNDDYEKLVFSENLLKYYKDSNLGVNVSGDISSVEPGEELLFINTLIIQNTGGIPGKEISVNPINGDPCMDINKIGTVGLTGKCTNLIIVDRALLDKIVSYESTANPELLTRIREKTYLTTLPNGVYTGQVTDMQNVFKNFTTFNGDIGYWDVSNVKNMGTMFNNAKLFNKDISAWDVSHVEMMNSMFYGANKFNQNISTWCIPAISSKPGGYLFDYGTHSSFYLNASKQPNWGCL